MKELKPKRIHRSNAYLEALKNYTPMCESKSFIPPPTLTSEELRIWEQLVNVFKETPNHPACDLDIHLMERYCRTKANYEHYLKELNKNSDYYIPIDTGMIYKQGQAKMILKTNPLYKLIKECETLLDKLAYELCLTHKARVKYGISAAKNNQSKDDAIFESLMNRSDD